jgi:CheY-like chemotaxis protein
MNFDLRNCMEELLDLMAFQAHRKQIELNLLIDDNVPIKLDGDLVRLSQVLTLLLIDAVEVLSEGEIKLQVQLQETTPAIARLKFTIVHSSVFLSEQEQYEIANFLAQADGWTEQSVAIDSADPNQELASPIGTDLAVCRSLVQMMAGTIGLTIGMGERGEETQYWFSTAFSLPSQQSAIAPLIDLTGLKLLIVSENSATRAVLKQYAQIWQIKAEEAINSAVAMNMLRHAASDAKPYQIAIIDMQMSVLNGAVLGKTILADSSLQDTKLVIACFATQQQESEKLCQQGFAAVLVKPIKQLPLLHALVEAGANLKATTTKHQASKTSTLADKSSPIDRPTATKTATATAEPNKSEAMPEQELLDVDHLIKLCEGNQVVINKMLAQFIEDLPHSTRALQEAIAKQDFFAIQQHAHFIKGASATIGMHQVKQLAEQIELETKKQLTTESSQLIDEVVSITTNLLTNQNAITKEIQAKLAMMEATQLPIATQTAQSDAGKEQVSEKVVNILVVDDDRLTLTLVADSLQKLPNYKIITAKNGKEAWQHLSSIVFDAIVSDWSMPDMSGIVLCQRIKFYPQLPSTAAPFILLTAYSNSEYKKIARDAGVDDFLVKPVDPDALRNMVSFWVAEFRVRQDRSLEI